MMRSWIMVGVASSLVACGAGGPEPETDPGPAGFSGAPADRPAGADIASNPTRDAYFGDLHVHTAYSFDAYLFGTVAMPDEAYAFARGASLEHPAGFTMQLDRPLDFQAVADHATYLGMLPAMTDPSSPAFEHPEAQRMREVRTNEDRATLWAALWPYHRGEPGAEGYLNADVVSSAWADIVASANRNNEPGVFTAFIAYEYTSSGDARDNLHRNVVFRGERAPVTPFSRLESMNPEDLWMQMERWRADGVDSLAIPHNANGSGGRMFERNTYYGAPIDPAYSALRMRNEPLVEITQVKGTSETHPALSPNDEWAGFEIMPYRIASTALSGVDGNYVRDALGVGLELSERGAGNPFRFGVIGSSDTHLGGGGYPESDYSGAMAFLDATPSLRGSTPGYGVQGGQDDGSGRTFADTNYQLWSASGLAGVWAESNTREALFDAMRRKETFATSGPRIRVRFFAGAALAELSMDAPDYLENAYAVAAPMGGDIYPDDEARAPVFHAWAVRDPLDAPLQRLQIVKSWLGPAGQAQEAVFDVACSDGLSVDPETHRCPDNGALVDLSTCAISDDAGADELKTTWTDPVFEPSQAALYYVRVLQNPTCRWSTWDAIRSDIEPRRDIPPILQDRAWSSPIWYTPSR